METQEKELIKLMNNISLILLNENHQHAEYHSDKIVLNGEESECLY